MTPTAIDVDIFAGPGGIDTGIRWADPAADIIGVEHDPAACATARAAGHTRHDDGHPDRPGTADVATVDPHTVTGGRPVRILAGGPPCPPWSKAGKRLGLKDQPRILDHVEAVAVAGEWVPYDPDGWHDPRSPLVLEPMRWVLALGPVAVMMEQVPDVLPYWRVLVTWLRGLGYTATAGVLSAEQYGVGQTRQRAFLVARRDGRPARLPVPTHARYVPAPIPTGPADGLFEEPARGRVVAPGDRHLRPWLSMADVLGWGGNAAERPARTLCGDRSPRWMYEQGPGSYGTGWTLRTRCGYDGEEVTREHNEPAPTFTVKAGGQWVINRPATTVQGDPRVAGPGHRDRAGGQPQFDADAVRLTVEQAAALQSFPPGYPWQGTKTARFRQIGDAVPPLLAAAVAAELLNRPWP